MQDEDIPRAAGPTALGNAIRRARRRRDMTQEALALESGLQRKTVHQIERAKIDPRLSTLQRIASAIDIELSELFAGPSRTADGSP